MLLPLFARVSSCGFCLERPDSSGSHAGTQALTTASQSKQDTMTVGLQRPCRTNLRKLQQFMRACVIKRRDGDTVKPYALRIAMESVTARRGEPTVATPRRAKCPGNNTHPVRLSRTAAAARLSPTQAMIQASASSLSPVDDAALAAVRALQHVSETPSFASLLTAAPAAPALSALVAEAAPALAAPVSDEEAKPPVSDEEAKRQARRERNRLHAVASRKRRREKAESLEAENGALKAENDALRAEVQRLRVQNARLVDPVSVNAAAAIAADPAGPLAGDNAAAWLGMSA